MKITVKSKINKNRCKNLTHLQVFTGQLRCLDVLTLDQLFKLIQRPNINNCKVVSSRVLLHVGKKTVFIIVCPGGYNLIL